MGNQKISQYDAIASMAVNSWINKNRVIWPNIDLSCMVFRGINMTFCEIPGAHLRCSNFLGCDFRWSDLQKTNLVSVRFDYSDIRFVDMRGAVHFGMSNFTDCFVDGCQYEDEIIRRSICFLDYSQGEIKLFQVKDQTSKKKKLLYKIFFRENFYTFEEFEDFINEKNYEEYEFQNLEAALEFFKSIAWIRG